MLAGGGGLGVALMLYVLVWEPWQDTLQRLRTEAAAQRTDLAWMRAAAREIQRLSATREVNAPAHPNGGSLLTVVDRTARAAGLGSALKRVEPQGTDRVRASLEGAAFDTLVRWLGRLEREHGIVTLNAVVDRDAESGRVDARLVMGTGGS